ncbi:MAG: PRC-barrel domain-containing protein [Candidatus Woesearchaeota archaeon]
MKKFTLKKNISLDETTKSFIKKRVLAKSGESVGKVKELILDTGKITGLIIRGKCEFFIDYQYVDEVSKAILLSISPITRLLGKKVYDSDGKKLGKVKDILQKANTNQIKEITVKKSIIKTLIIPATEIEIAEENIILNKTY